MTTSIAPATPTRVPLTEHPCFDEAARARAARVHLPVAPRCNVQCNYCNRRFDCVAESRPGVSSTLLTPEQAADYVDMVRRDIPALAVVGIAGPGDPFANVDKTLRTLRLVKQRHPDLLLCVSSNGLGVPAHLDDIAELGISHVTITMSTVDPEVGGRIYRWVRDGRGKVYRGREAGELLLARQIESIRGLKDRGITVKVNTVLVPGITLDGVADVARLASELGVDTMNEIALYPVEGTPFGELDAPTAHEVARARSEAAEFVQQMTHCQRCRADAVGLLGDDNDDEAITRLFAARTIGRVRTRIAVCSQDGKTLDQTLGGADRLLVYENANLGGRITPQLVEERVVPPIGGGAARWTHLAGLLQDCRALICYQLGGTARTVLRGCGISVYEAEGAVGEALTDVFGGRPPRLSLDARSCATDCDGPGDGLAPGDGCRDLPVVQAPRARETGSGIVEFVLDEGVLSRRPVDASGGAEIAPAREQAS
ncbi:nitrogenase cofactor biosynthesis protein NifB [Brooklawnia cerclae]|uniref:FeMo cofactor biosynthesis protein NifB n=1 Tax=Brooklawnia cerclae TaxID=349934 RepID=A0ABX0SKF3_9ACTN|nr:nitrogen fixation protein NifB [Brooklawnia cerclae]